MQVSKGHALLLASLFGSSHALAAEEATAKITPNMNVYNRLLLSESSSERGLTSDFTRWRLGLKASAGAGFGEVQLQGAAFSPPIVGTRQAHVGLDYYGFSVAYGRWLFLNQDVWGSAEALYNDTGFGSIDGVKFAYKIPVADGHVTALVGLGNGWQEETSKVSDTETNPSSMYSDKITLVGVKAELAGVNAKLGFGTKANSTISKDGVSNKKELEGTFKSVSQIEFSAGYDHQGLFSGGLWYSSMMATKAGALEAQATKTGKLKFTAVDNAGDGSLSHLGLGAGITSNLWGMTDVLSKGGLITSGLSYTMSDLKKTKSLKVAEWKDSKWSTIALGAGWKNEAVVAELSYVMKSSNEKDFKDAKGKDKKSHSEILVSTEIIL